MKSLIQIAFFPTVGLVGALAIGKPAAVMFETRLVKGHVEDQLGSIVADGNKGVCALKIY